jgi:glyceraldehyde 3-phosphate dehydrogenase
MAHLLKYDSSHGIFSEDVKAEGDCLIVGGKSIKVLAHKNPADLKWGDLGVDLVLECTGAFKKKEEFQVHLKNGAKKVIVSAPAEGVDWTVVMGVNHKDYDPVKHHIVSNASCTTNCLAPVAKVLHEQFGIEAGTMTTVHSYTNDQKILDASHKDFRRARSAAVSMIPTTTGAAKAVGLVLPELKGKLDGFAIRVPTPNVSLVDLTFRSAKPVSVQAINEALIQASQGSLKGILACEAKELVSVDFNGNTASSTIDLPSTMVVGERMAKVVSWYDNEAGFSKRMIELAQWMTK